MSSQDKLALVTGATGRQGGAVARHLLARGWKVRALTRKPEGPAAQALTGLGAEVVPGDLKDRASVERAVAGCRGVFAVQDTWEHGPESEIEQGRHLADAAQAAGVQHFVYSSVGGAERGTGIPHFESKWELEQYIAGLGLRTTVLRPVFFMENLLMPDNRQAIVGGTFALSVHPDTRLQMIATDDIGAFGAMAFDDPEEWIGRAVELAGDERTMAGYAQSLTQAVGRPVQFVESPTLEEMRGLNPDWATMCEWFIDHGYEADLPGLRQLHPPLKDFDAWLAGVTW
ncbi:MAG: NmrA/HSCARG family protein [Armatimonadetes bacterium]|nr:NmrA/HSCARG family protein [Armatimonadota bacterium]